MSGMGKNMPRTVDCLLQNSKENSNLLVIINFNIIATQSNCRKLLIAYYTGFNTLLNQRRLNFGIVIINKIGQSAAKLLINFGSYVQRLNVCGPLINGLRYSLVPLNTQKCGVVNGFGLFKLNSLYNYIHLYFVYIYLTFILNFII